MLGVKWLGHAADHSSPPCAKVKNSAAIALPLYIPSWYTKGQLYTVLLCGQEVHI